MNVDSLETLTEKEKDVYKKIYDSLKEGSPLTEKEFEILVKVYKETNQRMGIEE